MWNCPIRISAAAGNPTRVINDQISDMKKRLSSIVREYKFDSVQAFYKELKAARREYLDY